MPRTKTRKQSTKASLFSYEWRLADGFPALGMKKNHLKVFSCFAGGGGSSMGYKLAGYNVLGGNEIDSRMSECYIWNLKPKMFFTEGIKEFLNRKNKPDELYALDILDGSPPCSTFSIAGNREKDWGKKKKFREGQTKQVLDTLFFDFIDLVEELKPKMVVGENVSGMLVGKAVTYVNRIHDNFEKIGYHSTHYLLDASFMGVPQHRRRVFFLALRKDLIKKNSSLIKTKGFFDKTLNLQLKFKKNQIPFKKIDEGIIPEKDSRFIQIPSSHRKYWPFCKIGNSLASVHPRKMMFNWIKLNPNVPCNTIPAVSNLMHHTQKRLMSPLEIILASSWPSDYDFRKQKTNYVCGMSVPPVMMAQVAHQIAIQLLKPFSEKRKKDKKKRKAVLKSR